MNNYLDLYVTELAREDLSKSIMFYEIQSENLGLYFKDSLISDLEALLFYAGIHQKYFGYYRMLAKRFPFSIYYRIEDTRIVVHAIIDDRRDPKFHQERLLK